MRQINPDTFMSYGQSVFVQPRRKLAVSKITSQHEEWLLRFIIDDQTKNSVSTSCDGFDVEVYPSVVSSA